MCTNHFLKKKKKWNGIVAMELPNSIPLFTIPKVFFLPPILATPLPQLPKIYTLYFNSAIVANFFFSSHFRQWHCHNCQKKFFFPSFGFPCAHSHFEHPPGQQVWAEGIAVISLLKQKISLSYFLSFSFQLLLNFGNGIAAIHSLFSCY